MSALAPFFALGVVALWVQTLLWRELLVVVHGTELVLGVLMGSWMLWVGLGALLGRRVAARPSRPRPVLGALLVLGGLAPLGGLELVRHAERLWQLEPGLIPTFSQGVLLTELALAPFCLVVGFAFPLGCRCAAERELRAPAVSLYVAEALGSAAGGVLFVALLVGQTAPITIALLGLALLCLGAALAQPRATRRAWLLVPLAALAIVPFGAGLDRASRRAQFVAANPGQELVDVFDTPYGQLALGRMEDELTVYADGSPTATFPDPYENPEVAYAFLAQTDAAADVLIIGEPASGVAVELLRGLDGRRGGPLARVTSVWPDRRALEGLRPHLPAADAALLGSRLELRSDDPRAFLRGAAGRFDLVVLDLPPPTTAALNRFYTAELFATAARALTANGVLALRLPSSSTALGPEAARLDASVLRALTETFPHTVVTGGDPSYLFASTGAAVLGDDRARVARRLEAYPGAAPHLAAVLDGYAPEQMRRRRAELEAAPASANLDDRPASYTYASALWDLYSAPRAAGAHWLLRAVEGLASWPLAVPLLVLGALTLLWLLLPRLSGGSAKVIDAATTVGLAGAIAMAISLLLLLRYQSACGALYERLAMMSALFLFGSAGGAWSSGRALARGRGPRGLLLVVWVATGLLALALPLATAWLSAAGSLARELGFALLFALAGGCVGATFSPSVALLSEGGAPAARAARIGGLLDAMDFVGATVGALLTGTLLLPAIGAGATAELIAALAAAAALVWALRCFRAAARAM